MNPQKGTTMQPEFTLRVLTLQGTSKCRISETPKRPKGSPKEIPDPFNEIPRALG